jgi:CHAT domain-containing protein
MGQVARAEPAFQRSLAIYEARLGPEHLLVAESLHNLGELYRFLGQNARAAALFQRSLTIRQAKLDRNHPQIALSLQSLGLLYQRMGQFAEAEPLCRRSLAILETSLGAEHPLVATSLDSLATLYRDMNQFDKAEPLYQRSLEIRQTRLGEGHHLAAASMNNLAALYKLAGRFEKAEPLYQRSLELAQARLGQDHPDVATTLNNLAALSEATGQTERAADLLDRARRGTRRYAAQVLPTLSEADQAAFLQIAEGARSHAALSLALRHAGNPGMRARSAEWLLNSKAVALQALAEATLLARDNQDPALADVSRQLQETRRRLAQLTLAPPRGQESAAALEKQRQSLSAREQELARLLRRAGGRAARDGDWVELNALRRRLPAGAAFIDLARFKVLDFKDQKTWQAERYVAWITRSQGEVQMVDLGPADAIDRAVEQVRQALAEAPREIRRLGEPAAEKGVREHLDRLAARLLEPLLPHIGASPCWIICPDGELWLAPWSALPLPDGKYAIEEHTICHVVSGRDLVRDPAGAGVKATAPLVLADPDFDLELTAVAQESRQALGRQPPDSGLRSVAGLPLERVQRLPGTAVEAEAILPRLKACCGPEPQLFTQGKASVSVFLAARHCRMVVLSTHGFFLREADDKTRTPGNWENPLLRCGLLLAGCKHAGKVQHAADNGLLTGLQIVGCDLRGCELVVLSACETGLGTVRNGEGVAGLRQAFQLAGAQNVAATLWQVDDTATAQLMVRFFDNLVQKRNQAEALRQAQLALLQDRRERNAAAHPFYWAAFTLTGAVR